MAAGNKRQETRMNRLHTCSQSQRPRKRMGRVKLPFIRPERMASKAPAASVVCIHSSNAIEGNAAAVFLFRGNARGEACGSGNQRLQ